MSPSELKQARAQAGAAYAAKAKALLDAYVELLALDMTCSNENVSCEGVLSFTGHPKLPLHRDFWPQGEEDPAGTLWPRAEERHADLLASLTPGA